MSKHSVSNQSVLAGLTDASAFAYWALNLFLNHVKDISSSSARPGPYDAPIVHLRVTHASQSLPRDARSQSGSNSKTLVVGNPVSYRRSLLAIMERISGRFKGMSVYEDGPSVCVRFDERGFIIAAASRGIRCNTASECATYYAHGDGIGLSTSVAVLKRVCNEAERLSKTGSGKSSEDLVRSIVEEVGLALDVDSDHLRVLGVDRAKLR